MLQDQYRAIMQYSIPKELCPNSEKPPSHKASADWFCIKVISLIDSLIFRFHPIKFNFSVGVKTSKGEIIVLSVTPRAWKARKGAVGAMKFAIMLQKVNLNTK